MPKIIEIPSSELIPLAALENYFDFSAKEKNTQNKINQSSMAVSTKKPFMPELCGVKDPVKNICNKLTVKGRYYFNIHLKSYIGKKVNQTFYIFDIKN